MLEHDPFTTEWLLCTWMFTPSFSIVGNSAFVILSHVVLILEWTLFSLGNLTNYFYILSRHSVH